MRTELLRRRVGILGERNFRRFYAGFVTSLLGSSMSSVAIAWAVLDSKFSATGLGVVFTANVVPQVLLLPLAGAIADRLGRRRVMLAADVLRCCAQTALAAALAVGRPALWLFVLLAWLGGTGTAFFSPTLDALTVEIAPRDQLGNANTLYGLAGSATTIAGPALGGALIAVAGQAVVVAADAASYAVSVLALSLLRLPAPAPRPGGREPGGGEPAAASRRRRAGGGEPGGEPAAASPAAASPAAASPQEHPGRNRRPARPCGPRWRRAGRTSGPGPGCGHSPYSSPSST